MGSAFLLTALLSAPAFAGLVECVDSSGNTRLTNEKCRPDEKRAESAPIVAKKKEKGQAPAGVLADSTGKAVRFKRGAWTVRSLTAMQKWNRHKKIWEPSGEVNEAELDAAHNAVEVFNMNSGLDIRLTHKEIDASQASLNDVWKDRAALTVYWAEDGKPGSLPPPYSSNGKTNSGGCAVVLKNKDGSEEYFSGAPIKPGAAISGAALFLVELSRTVRENLPCGKKAPRVLLLRELGRCLGLTDKVPPPSIMSGSCGEDYLENDIAAFNHLYGRAED